MGTNKLSSSLINIFNEILNADEELKLDQIKMLSKSDCLDWDSMNSLNIILAVEEEFQISIPDDVAHTLDSFAKFEDFLIKQDT
tara:strand:- start:1595 stop:1846 length:252 start_codon:yes stop_codon:yes gene_type:complete